MDCKQEPRLKVTGSEHIQQSYIGLQIVSAPCLIFAQLELDSTKQHSPKKIATLKTMDRLWNMSIGCIYEQQSEFCLPSQTMLSHLTKLVLSGNASWVKDAANALSMIRNLQKLRVFRYEFEFKTDAVLQSFANITRYVSSCWQCQNKRSLIT